MKSITKALAKGTLGTVAAGAMVMGVASPAAAQDRHRDRDRDGISAGEVIAGAVILGGLAAIIASSDNDRDDYRDYRGDYRDGYRGDYRGNYRGGYGNGHGSRDAVELCVRAAENQAQRRLGARAEVYEIRDVDRERRGYEVEGRIAVRDGYRGRDQRRWGRNDYRRGYRNDGWDEGRFSCDVRNGRVTDLDFSGIRGL